MQGQKQTEAASREQEQAGLGNVAMFTVVGEDAVVTDAGEVVREQVVAEAGEELEAGEFARLDPVAIGIVTVGEADGAGVRIEVLEVGVGDGDAMGVVGQIG